MFAAGQPHGGALLGGEADFHSSELTKCSARQNEGALKDLAEGDGFPPSASMNIPKDNAEKILLGLG
ncbi:MAG: hypothetical protein NTV57_17980 [Cyanobacteria bacterium]|nr:hypothetical protein [Cyanobacteriota bacterium]